ncbi:unnamed protein product [Cyprideis torosa]|uniref:Uncharacterized protein n=1 Tax=Cyprideis torosa TaxID=163714 RepID=A0A7R8WL51_9CRUS|nr:unnamed protein product [Cyprideis torosa]CAG0897681.1 unnamed protein product [Cyprideis torosa]
MSEEEDSITSKLFSGVDLTEDEILRILKLSLVVTDRLQAQMVKHILQHIIRRKLGLKIPDELWKRLLRSNAHKEITLETVFYGGKKEESLHLQCFTLERRFTLESKVYFRKSAAKRATCSVCSLQVIKLKRHMARQHPDFRWKAEDDNPSTEDILSDEGPLFGEKDHDDAPTEQTMEEPTEEEILSLEEIDLSVDDIPVEEFLSFLTSDFGKHMKEKLAKANVATIKRMMKYGLLPSLAIRKKFVEFEERLKIFQKQRKGLISLSAFRDIKEQVKRYINFFNTENAKTVRMRRTSALLMEEINDVTVVKARNVLITAGVIAFAQRPMPAETLTLSEVEGGSTESGVFIVYVRDHKTGKSYPAPLAWNSEEKRLLDIYSNWRKSLSLTHDKFFVTQNLSPISNAGLIVSGVFAKAGVEGFTACKNRRTTATTMRDKDKTVSRILSKAMTHSELVAEQHYQLSAERKDFSELFNKIRSTRMEGGIFPGDYNVDDSDDTGDYEDDSGNDEDVPQNQEWQLNLLILVVKAK